VRGDQIIEIPFSIIVWRRTLGQTNLEIHEIYIGTGDSAERLIVSNLPYVRGDTPIMRGDLLVLCTVPDTLILLDWRAQRCVALDLGCKVRACIFNILPIGDSILRQCCTPGLLPGHLVVASTRDDRPQLEVYDIEIFESLWQPLVDLTSTACADMKTYHHLTLRLIPPIEYPPTHFGLGPMCIWESPVKIGTFKIAIYLFDDELRAFRYTHLATMGPRDAGVTLRSIYAGAASDGLYAALSFSYAGYMVTYRDLWQPDSYPDLTVMRRPPGCESTHLSTYSCALTREFSDSMVISYYE
jgi:hypothetical protein